MKKSKFTNSMLLSFYSIYCLDFLLNIIAPTHAVGAYFYMVSGPISYWDKVVHIYNCTAVHDILGIFVSLIKLFDCCYWGCHGRENRS